ncbi:MAG: DUF4126 domain-containing protein [Methylophilus sp.]|nr:DUF4126 domain-containing protein [Methylophilus sp.]
MEQNDYMDAISSFALASGLSWASGFRLYATVFAVGLLSRYGYLQLPQTLDILRHPAVLAVAGALMLVEFLADKIPYVDSMWDSVQTFIRIPAGALLAMGAMNTSDPIIATLAALLGGSLTGITHATKAGSRALINTSPEPVSNVTTSFGEDGLWLGGGWLALAHPMVFIGVILLLVFVMLWMLPKLWRGIKLVLNQLSRILRLSSN